MYTKEDILKRLQAGEEVQSIGDEIAKVINDALNEYEALKTAEAVAKKKQEFVKQRDADARHVADAMCDFLEKYGGMPKATEEQRAEIARSLPELAEGTNTLWSELGPLFEAEKAKVNLSTKPVRKVKTTESDKEAILEFLKTL